MLLKSTTELAIRSEAMKDASQVYNYVKAKQPTGLKPLADQLGEQFQKAGKPKTGARGPLARDGPISTKTGANLP